MKEDNFANEMQKEVSLALLNDGYTVDVDRNSYIMVYVTEHQSIHNNLSYLQSYVIRSVFNCQHDEFMCKVVLEVDWEDANSEDINDN